MVQSAIANNMGRKLFVVFILLFSFLLAPKVLNESYAVSCKNPRPEVAPVLLSAEAKDRSVVLTWKEAIDPVTHYLVAYSRNKTDLEYGNPNVGPRGTTTYTVLELTNGIKYYFKVRAENGCKPGKFSNKLSAIPGFANRPSSFVRQPNLSIYKVVAAATVSATPAEELDDEKIPPPAPLIVAGNQSLNCSTCTGLPLLGVELLLLAGFFYFSKKYIFLKQIYSVLIPFFVYLVFYKINGSCPNDSFWCKYFVQLNIILFMATIIFYKNKYININFAFVENLLTNKNKKRKRKR